jgi:hypothetical protein
VKATAGARSLNTFPVELQRGPGWSPERRRVSSGVSSSPEIQDHLGGRLGSLLERTRRILGSDLAVSQLLGFAEGLELLE